MFAAEDYYEQQIVQNEKNRVTSVTTKYKEQRYTMKNKNEFKK
jgi:hypothetical protein